MRTKRGLNDRRASWETKDGQRERSQKTDKKEIEQKVALDGKDELQFDDLPKPSQFTHLQNFGVLKRPKLPKDD